MDAQTARLLEAIVVATPAIIAAISSLRNGREQKRVKNELAETNGKLAAVAHAVRPQTRPHTREIPRAEPRR